MIDKYVTTAETVAHAAREYLEALGYLTPSNLANRPSCPELDRLERVVRDWNGR